MKVARRHERSPFNNVEVVPIIILINDVLAFDADLLKHGIQHLRHLFLWWWINIGQISKFTGVETIMQNPLRVLFLLLQNNYISLKKSCIVHWAVTKKLLASGRVLLCEILEMEEHKKTETYKVLIGNNPLTGSKFLNRRMSLHASCSLCLCSSVFG